MIFIVCISVIGIMITSQWPKSLSESFCIYSTSKNKINFLLQWLTSHILCVCQTQHYKIDQTPQPWEYSANTLWDFIKYNKLSIVISFNPLLKSYQIGIKYCSSNTTYSILSLIYFLKVCINKTRLYVYWTQKIYKRSMFFSNSFISFKYFPIYILQRSC